MDRTAVFVDAGYLFAEGSRLIAGEKLLRGELHLEHDAVLKLLAALTQELTGLPLLRVYWYDGASTGPTPQQLALAYRPSVKLRLGFVNQQGQQNGVDSLIVTDLINLARNRAMTDALLMTGDDDIRVGVQQAQEFGVRVHLLGISPSRENQSGALVQEADGVRELSDPEIRSFLTLSPSASVPPSGAPASGRASAASEDLSNVARKMASDLSPEEIYAVLQESAGGSVPAQIDRRLLVAGSLALGGVELTSDQKRQLRVAFLAICREAI